MTTIVTRSLMSILKRRFFARLFRIATKDSLNIFFRGKDVISIDPQVFGFHEEILTRFIAQSASSGLSDFLVDIGANIGLSSCQNGSAFQKVICFEPNPLCANVLRTNLAISLDESSFEVHEFALGQADGEFDLYIPRYNWGGAFVRESNGYSDRVLSAKDGFNNIETKNYLVRTVTVKDAECVFAGLFSSLAGQGLEKGVVKIDVEGFEKLVVSALAKALPRNFEVLVVFENFDPDFALKEIADVFPDRNISFSKFERSVMGRSRSLIRTLAELCFFGERFTARRCAENESVVGDVILRVT